MLTMYQITTAFDDPVLEAFQKHCVKRRKYWLPAFSPFPTMFLTLKQEDHDGPISLT